MNIYLVRHTAVDVPRGICYGQSDVPLKETFVHEAADVAGRLDAVLPDKSILDAVYTEAPFTDGNLLGLLLGK